MRQVIEQKDRLFRHAAWTGGVLKSMEEHRVVVRQKYATVPPTVEYSLTSKDKALEPVILNLYKWGQEYADK